MPSYDLRPLRRFEFDADVYVLRADLQGPWLLMNAGADQLRVIDVDSMVERLVDLRPFAPEFLIYSWTLDQNGECSLLASSDPLPFAIGLNHRSWALVRIALPSPPTHLSPMLWTTPRFAVMGLDGQVWNGTREGPVASAQDEDEASRNAMYARLVKEFSVFSFDCETHDACVVGADGQLGMASARDWHVRPAMPWTADVIGAAHHRGHLFACTREQVEVVGPGGRQQVLAAPAGFEFLGIVIGPCKRGAYLAVLSGAVGGSRLPCRVDVHDLVVHDR